MPPHKLTPADKFILHYLAKRDTLVTERENPYQKAPLSVLPKISPHLTERAIRFKKETQWTARGTRPHSLSLYEPFITNARQAIYMLLYFWARWEVEVDGETIYGLFFKEISPILAQCAEEHQCYLYAPGSLTRIVGSLYNDGLIDKVEVANPDPTTILYRPRVCLYFVPAPGLMRDEEGIETLLKALQARQTYKYVSGVSGRMKSGYNSPRPHRGVSAQAREIVIGPLPPATDDTQVLRGNPRWAARPITGPLGDGSQEDKKINWF